MPEPAGRPPAWLWPAVAVLIALGLLTGIGLAAYVVYRHYTVDYTVTREEDGVAISKVVDARLDSAVDLRVSKLTGTVQATSADAGWGGMLASGLVFKAPFEADYFVDLSKLDRGDFFWDAKTRTLIVNPPDVRVDSVNVDEGRATLDQTTGLLVTRGAMTRLRQRASTHATQAARSAAATPSNIARARDNARVAIADLYQRPLRAAGLDATVRVRFKGEAVRNDEQWDRSKSIAEILAASR
ncbi:DUF4230 domain-containing protein [Sphingomonas immobilis]|uniref:DUF4230 domain-containing protein n=1 Tax=Sphingomonas immobilis TaxID=3063997 RepID=A0ABT8ZV76_9SPHN|nr:DUF4230 domain-containing protein [Sphingomonas sp. CA1-15]MDO7841039.1 DUF4230 domain-containing protein [Sphingomonas sp. CA1-15]